MLQVSHLYFGYSEKTILQDLSFSVNRGENLAVIGESGSGKSTLLKLIYGEHDLHSGTILWNDERILGPKHNLVVGYDFMKYVAQEFELMPFISVEENIAKHLSRFFPETSQQRVDELIAVVELEAFAKTKVKHLSGGQKQRVALARALAKKPEILLLDEPFSHIDNFKKQSLRRNIFNFLKKENITCIVATHDRDDVLGFADKILVIHNKTIIAKGTPEQLYKTPANALVASFFGEYNLIKDTLYYAHQLKIVENSNNQAQVKQSYFNGNSWLIEATYLSGNILIAHHEKLQPDKQICFVISAKT